MSNPKRIKLDNNIITKSFDYSQIDEAEMIQREADARDYSKNRWAGTMGEISNVYKKCYEQQHNIRIGIYHDPVIPILEPPPLFIQCIIKLRKYGLKADPVLFKEISPDLAIVLELMRDVKMTPWSILGQRPFDGYHYYLHVNCGGKRKDYGWFDDLDNYSAYQNN